MTPRTKPRPFTPEEDAFLCRHAGGAAPPFARELAEAMTARGWPRAERSINFRLAILRQGEAVFEGVPLDAPAATPAAPDDAAPRLKPKKEWTAAEDAWLRQALSATPRPSGADLARGLAAAGLGAQRQESTINKRLRVLGLVEARAPRPRRPIAGRPGHYDWTDEPSPPSPAALVNHGALVRRVIDRIFSHGATGATA